MCYILGAIIILFLLSFIFCILLLKGSMTEYDKYLEDQEQMQWINEHMKKKGKRNGQ